MAIDAVASLPIPLVGPDTSTRNATSANNSSTVSAPVQAASSGAQQQSKSAAVQAAVSQLQDYLASSNRAIEYRTDGATGLTVVTVSDPETGDVIRQIPNEEVLRLAQALNDSTAKGANALLHLTA